MRSGSLICILASFILAASSVEARESLGITHDTYKILEKEGTRAFKSGVLWKIKYWLDDLKPRLNNNNTEERMKYLINNAVDAMELLSNETLAVVIPNDDTQLDPVNKALIHILDEFGFVYQTLSKSGTVINDDPSNRWTRQNIKNLYRHLEEQSGKSARFYLMETLTHEINYVWSKISYTSGFEEHLASFAKESMEALKKRVEDMQLPNFVIPTEKQVAEMTDIVGEFLGIYDVAVKSL